MSEALRRLHAHGQSTWLDFIRRAFIDSGELQGLIDDGWISGLTSNPTIFGRAIAGSTDYDDELRAIAAAGTATRTRPSSGSPAPTSAAPPTPSSRSTRRAARQTATSPSSSPRASSTTPRAPSPRRSASSRAVGRPNVMIKVPGTAAAPATVEALIGDGVNVNITLLFAVDVYESVARAYIVGLERGSRGRPRPLDDCLRRLVLRLARGHRRRQQAAGRLAPSEAAPASPTPTSPTAGFGEIFSGEAWERLAAAGARVQRPLWASTGTKNPAYSDVLYVDGLLAPDSVNTLPEATLRAFADHGEGTHAISADDIAAGDATIAALTEAGVDVKAVTDKLLVDGLASFEADFKSLLDCIDEALTTIRSRPRPPRR